MNLVALVPLPYRLLALAALAAALVGFGWIKGVQHEEEKVAAVQARWDAERAALTKQVGEQRLANLDLQRQAEQRQAERTEIRDHFITKTITEVRHATDNLAACRLAPDAVRLLNAAGDCAREDRPASCGPDQQVRDPGAAP